MTTTGTVAAATTPPGETGRNTKNWRREQKIAICNVYWDCRGREREGERRGGEGEEEEDENEDETGRERGRAGGRVR